MIILNKEEFKTLLENNPGKKFAFVEWKPRINNSNLHITDGDIKDPLYGASVLSPQEERETFRRDIYPGDQKYNHEGTLNHDIVLVGNDAIEHFLPSRNHVSVTGDCSVLSSRLRVSN